MEIKIPVEKLRERGLYPKEGPLPPLVEDPSTKEVFYLNKTLYTKDEIKFMLEEFEKHKESIAPARATTRAEVIKDREGRFGSTLRGKTRCRPVIVLENSHKGDVTINGQRALELLSILKAQKQIGIKRPNMFELSNHGPNAGGINQNITKALSDQLNISYSLYSSWLQFE